MTLIRREDRDFLGNLLGGDPLENGGFFIYERADSRADTHDWSPKKTQHEAELFGEPNDEGLYAVYSFGLDRLKLVDGYLVPIGYKESWPHSLYQYDEWFHGSLDKIAESTGTTKEDVEKMFTSEDPAERAHAYEMVGLYHGFENLDHDPRSFTKPQMKKRYRSELRELKKAGR